MKQLMSAILAVAFITVLVLAGCDNADKGTAVIQKKDSASVPVAPTAAALTAQSASGASTLTAGA